MVELACEATAKCTKSQTSEDTLIYCLFVHEGDNNTITDSEIGLTERLVKQVRFSMPPFFSAVFLSQM